MEENPAVNYCYEIIKNLQSLGERDILVVGADVVTNKRFLHRVSTIAHLLKEENGLQVGDKVLIASSPNIEFYCIAIAVLAIGGVIVVLDPSMSFDRINHCITISHPSFFIYPKGSRLRYLKYIFPSVRAISKHVELHESTKVDSSDQQLMTADDVVPCVHALVTFTTGSTGMPKLLIREHSFLSNQSKSISLAYSKMAVELNVTKKEKDSPMLTNLPILPLHSLRLGCLVVMIPKFTSCDPATVINTVSKHNVTALVGSPAFAARLANYATHHNMMLPLSVVGVGGAPVFRSTLRSIASTIRDMKVAVVYGATEAEPISLISAQEKMAAEKDCPDGLCVGKPSVEGSVKIIPATDDPIKDAMNIDELELPPYQIGEILLTGWHVNTQQVDEKRLIHDKDGVQWLRIEDAGYKDTEGRIWLAGRVKWRTVNSVTKQTYWSTIVEQKVLERTSLITFAAYLPHNGAAYLFLEVPSGSLPEKEAEGLNQFLKAEGIPIDHLVIKKHIKKDRRHASKPDTGALFSGNVNMLHYVLNSVWFVLTHNPIILLVFLVLFVLLVVILCRFVLF